MSLVVSIKVSSNGTAVPTLSSSGIGTFGGIVDEDDSSTVSWVVSAKILKSSPADDDVGSWFDGNSGCSPAPDCSCPSISVTVPAKVFSP